MRTLIIDDEPIALEKLRNYVKRTGGLEIAGECRDGVEALAFMKDNEVDLVITDINMPDLNGLDFIKALPHRPMVIFTTAYADYAVEGYKVCAVDYLLKPFGYDDFVKAIERASARMESRNKANGAADDYIFLKADHRYIRVMSAEIQYIKGFGEYLQVFVDNRDRPLVVLSSFAAIMNRLPGCFMQIQRSYVANMNRVAVIERNRLILDSGAELPIGESYKSSIQAFVRKC